MEPWYNNWQQNMHLFYTAEEKKKAILFMYSVTADVVTWKTTRMAFPKLQLQMGTLS